MPLVAIPRSRTVPVADSLVSHATCHSVLKLHYSRRDASIAWGIPPRDERSYAGRGMMDLVQQMKQPAQGDPPKIIHAPIDFTHCSSARWAPRDVVARPVFGPYSLPTACPRVRRFANIGVMLQRRGRARMSLIGSGNKGRCMAVKGEGSDLIGFPGTKFTRLPLMTDAES